MSKNHKKLPEMSKNSQNTVKNVEKYLKILKTVKKLLKKSKNHQKTVKKVEKT